VHAVPCRARCSPPRRCIIGVPDAAIAAGHCPVDPVSADSSARTDLASSPSAVVTPASLHQAFIIEAVLGGCTGRRSPRGGSAPLLQGARGELPHSFATTGLYATPPGGRLTATTTASAGVIAKHKNVDFSVPDCQLQGRRRRRTYIGRPGRIFMSPPSLYFSPSPSTQLIFSPITIP
jgi:hypothetical protein